MVGPLSKTGMLNERDLTQNKKDGLKEIIKTAKNIKIKDGIEITIDRVIIIDDAGQSTL
jgi:hypothetical protein